MLTRKKKTWKTDRKENKTLEEIYKSAIITFKGKWNVWFILYHWNLFPNLKQIVYFVFKF